MNACQEPVEEGLAEDDVDVVKTVSEDRDPGSHGDPGRGEEPDP
jgi:hypothetical protein